TSGSTRSRPARCRRWPRAASPASRTCTSTRARSRPCAAPTTRTRSGRWRPSWPATTPAARPARCTTWTAATASCGSEPALLLDLLAGGAGRLPERQLAAAALDPVAEEADVPVETVVLGRLGQRHAPAPIPAVGVVVVARLLGDLLARQRVARERAA